MAWEQRWREGRTAWDAGGPSPTLELLVREGSLPNGRALVPGCGSGYDILALASPHRLVLGLDVAPTAVERFRALRRAKGLSPEVADGPYSVILDQVAKGVAVRMGVLLLLAGHKAEADAQAASR